MAIVDKHAASSESREARPQQPLAPSSPLLHAVPTDFFAFELQPLLITKVNIYSEIRVNP